MDEHFEFAICRAKKVLHQYSHAPMSDEMENALLRPDDLYTREYFYRERQEGK